MATGSGLDAQIGLAIEAAFGTFLAPTDFYEFNNEKLDPTVQELNSMPIGAGRFQKASRVVTFITGGSGTFEVDLVTKGMGKLFKMMFGAVDVQQVDDTDEYVHTFTPDVNGMRGLSASLQKGVPAAGSGAIVPLNFVGCKVTQWEIKCDTDAIAKLTTTRDFKGVDTVATLATPSYPADAAPFTFLDGSLTVGGVAVAAVKSITLQGANALATDRRYFGNNKGEQLANGEWAYTGSFDSEFVSRTAYDAWVNGTQLANVVLTFQSGEIAAGVPYKVVVTMPVIKYTGSAPEISGPDIVQQSLPFSVLWNETDPIISVAYHTTDQTP